MIALSLGRCKPFLPLPSCDYPGSIAAGPGNLQVQPCPQCPVSDARLPQCNMSRWATSGREQLLFTFSRLRPSQWRSVRTTNAIERLHEEFKRRIKTQTVLPSAATAAMLFWALLASGQISMRKVDGWQTLAEKLIAQPIDLAA
jgi:hypothetical protein